MCGAGTDLKEGVWFLVYDVFVCIRDVAGVCVYVRCVCVRVCAASLPKQIS